MILYQATQFSRNILHFFLCLLLIQCLACGVSQESKEEHEHTNHLINETSPYLLQHAHNPVDWYPWGEKALDKATAEDKLLIISVGYSACHWCHVMEEESFEDSIVAAYMNEHFVNIKVDREERPDVDDIYMTACQLSSNQGCGWPLNAFALPDGRPVGAVTYQPKDAWLQLLHNLVNLKDTEPEELERYASQITEGIKVNDEIAFREGEPAFKVGTLNTYAQQIMAAQDTKNGGRQGAPKFPMPGVYDFLLTYHYVTGNTSSKEQVLLTLDNIANGGIYDHLGGGFARYSTDARWHVPHFEKMLYDNAQLLSLYAKAYQLTDKSLYRKRIIETIDFLTREMESPAGGYYSSLDADTEGEEGTFYVWEKTEIDSLLPARQAEMFNFYYGITKQGNWEDKKNILHIQTDTNRLEKKFKLSRDSIRHLLTTAKKRLFEMRDERPKPGRDDKILSAWNGLTIIGLTDAFRAVPDSADLNKALAAGQFLRDQMIRKDYRMDRNYKDGRATINAFLDDYAFTILAFIELYELTFDVSWLDDANSLAGYTLEHFFNEKSGMFHYRSDLDPPLIAEKTETGDNVIPGSNSSMARALHTLGLFYYNRNYLDISQQMMHNMENKIQESELAPFYYNWCRLYIDLVKPPYEIAILGPSSREVNHEMQTNFLPQAIFLGGEKEGKLELLQDKLQEGKTFIYVCQNKVCKFPVQETTAALELMD